MEQLLSDRVNIVIIALSFNFLLTLVLFFVLFNTRTRLKKLRGKYNKFMSGMSDRNMEELLEGHIERVQEVILKTRDLEKDINDIERILLQCVQKVGIIRYNAFENMGSDLCFTIALLDQNDNGILLNGIYARDSSSVYAKPVMSGKSKYALSAEEIQALETAKKAFQERVYKEV